MTPLEHTTDQSQAVHAERNKSPYEAYRERLNAAYSRMKKMRDECEAFYNSNALYGGEELQIMPALQDMLYIEDLMSNDDLRKKILGLVFGWVQGEYAYASINLKELVLPSNTNGFAEEYADEGVVALAIFNSAYKSPTVRSWDGGAPSIT